MIPPATYLLKVMLISGILFGYYVLALRNERFHEWNRYYLLVSTAISLALPFARWPDLFSAYSSSNPIVINRLQIFTVSAGDTGTSGLGWEQWLKFGYIFIALAFLTGTGFGLLKIYRSLQKGEKYHFRLFTLVRDQKTESPFSFFRFIFWSPKIPLDSLEGGHILHHELAHVQEKHSLDKLWMEIITALFWINPFFYLIRKELHVIHEFIADRKSCRLEDPHEYANLLVEQAFRNNKIAFANHFFQKRLTRRVHMLIRENKARFTYFKRIMAIPLTLLIVLFFLLLQSQAREKNIPLLKDAAKTMQNASAATLNNNKVFSFVEKMPQFPGGEAALMKFLHDHVHYPATARENGIEGTVVIQFVVNKDGHLSNLQTIGKRKGGGLEEEAIRVVKAMPRWIAGRQNGKKLNVRYSLPIRFQLRSEKPDLPVKKRATTEAKKLIPPPPPGPKPVTNAQPPSKNKVFQFVEQMPQFPGGQDALMKYLHDHIHYPQAARENGIGGTVVVQFIVNTNGSISSIKTVGAEKGGGLEEESIRVVENMPDWEPGRQNGRKVAVQYSLPIRYQLQ